MSYTLRGSTTSTFSGTTGTISYPVTTNNNDLIVIQFICNNGNPSLFTDGAFTTLGIWQRCKRSSGGESSYYVTGLAVGSVSVYNVMIFSDSRTSPEALATYAVDIAGGGGGSSVSVDAVTNNDLRSALAIIGVVTTGKGDRTSGLGSFVYTNTSYTVSGVNVAENGYMTLAYGNSTPSGTIYYQNSSANIIRGGIGLIYEVDIKTAVLTINAQSTQNTDATVSPWDDRVTINAAASVVISGSVTPFGSAASYVATTNGTTEGSPNSTPDVKPGAGKRSIIRFPLFGEFPPLATITKVEFKGSVSVGGGAATSYQLRSYQNNGDPEQDTFANQYTKANAGSLYVTTTQFRSTGGFLIDLGATAIADAQTLMYPQYGYFPLAIVETSGGTQPTIENTSLVISYTVPVTDNRPLHQLITVSILTAAVPPVLASLDIGEYALRCEINWQRPGRHELTVPLGSKTVQRMVDMGLVHLLLKDWPIYTGFLEKFNVRKMPDLGIGGLMLTVSGQSVHRPLTNRITGPFPGGGFSHDENAALTSIGTDVETFSTGDVSPRGSAFGAASASVESILLKMLKTHTTAADSNRRKAWTNNLSFGPDSRRGSITGTTVSTRGLPLLSEAERLAIKTDTGYAVHLDATGKYRVFFLPGINRVSDRGHWFISSELTPGIEEMEIDRDFTELITHVYVYGSGSGTTRNMSLLKQLGSLETLYDRREAAIDASNATSDAAAELSGRAFLQQHNYRQSVTVSLTNALSAGWLTAFNVGDLVSVVDADSGLSQTVRIFGVELIIGTELALSAMIDSPGYAAILSQLEQQISKDELLTAVTFTTGTNPDVVGATFKETSPAALK